MWLTMTAAPLTTLSSIFFTDNIAIYHDINPFICSEKVTCFLVHPSMKPDILYDLKIQHLALGLSLSFCSHAIWLMTLLLDLAQQAEAILLTALKQLIPCEVMEIQTVPAHRPRQ